MFASSLSMDGACSRARTRLPNKSQTCSMRFMSGLLAEMARSLIPTCCRYRWTTCAVCSVALSWYNKKWTPMKDAKGSIYSWKMSSAYLSTVSVPLLTICNAMRVPKKMPAHTITESPPKGILGEILQAEKCSPARLQNRIRPSGSCSVNLDSSVIVQSPYACEK